jgi:hypothetical protein
MWPSASRSFRPVLTSFLLRGNASRQSRVEGHDHDFSAQQSDETVWGVSSFPQVEFRERALHNVGILMKPLVRLRNSIGGKGATTTERSFVNLGEFRVGYASDSRKLRPAPRTRVQVENEIFTKGKKENEAGYEQSGKVHLSVRDCLGPIQIPPSRVLHGVHFVNSFTVFKAFHRRCFNGGTKRN